MSPHDRKSSSAFAVAAASFIAVASAPPALAIGLGTPGTVTGIRVSDVSGDGEQDIVCAVSGPIRRINTIPGAPGLTFGGMTSSSTSTGPEDVDICVDADHDGDKDLVVC